MLYGCDTRSPRACHYDTLRRAHHRFLTRCIGWRKHNRADHRISYLDTLIKTGSESIETTLRRRRILFGGFVARMEDTRLSNCVMFGEMVGGGGCVGGQEKEWTGCFLDDLRGFGINADQWTTAAQNKWEWRRTAEQGAEYFMAKWIAAEKANAGLRHAVVCPNGTGRTKERIAQRKRARAGSLALVECCCSCCFSHSAHWLPTRKKLLYTVADPARGLLSREKRAKEKVWQHTPPPHPPHCSFGEK